jgi:AcrR family transcriptional regulator
MTRSKQVRRPGYAPDNPAVGRRGLWTRERILTVAASMFVADGYHGTSIDSIATASGTSRATIYQYFESKDEIYAELYSRSEQAVLEHAARLGHLGPTLDGFQHLGQWLVDLTELFDQYAVVFLELPGIGMTQGALPPHAAAVSQTYIGIIVTKLRKAGLRDIDPRDAASIMLRIAHMVNLYRFRGMLGMKSIGSVTDSLAIAVQLLLFPDTPQLLMSGIEPQIEPQSPDAGDAEPLAVSIPDAGAVSPLRQDVLAAASALFADRGYHSVSMEDIAVLANVSRATLYRHFRTKVPILLELTQWAVLEGRDHSDELRRIARDGNDNDALRACLARYVHFHRTYGGVIRAWYDGTVAQQLPEDTVAQGLGAFHGAARALLTRIDLPPGINPTVAAVIFLAVLGRVSEIGVANHPNESDYDTAGLMLLVLQRALNLALD